MFLKSRKSIFLEAQNSSWYTEFLMPVVNSIMNITVARKILDIGTGPGRLPELLSHNKQLKIIGMDINPNMIEEANKRVKSENVTFQLIGKDESLNFNENEFDVITLCSVLFLLNDRTRFSLMNEALRVLKPGGKIIVLTPSGRKSSLSAARDIRSFPNSLSKYTFLIWHTLTSHRGSFWCDEKWLPSFAEENGLQYESTLVFKDYAIIEIITKNEKTKNV